MNEIKVSVITACYNSAKTIRSTFDHMLNQTYDNIEYIIVDGGSTDGTLDTIKEYIDKFPFPCKLISEKDDGIYDAMNKGIRMSTGTLIGINNSDDYYEDNAIEEIVKAYNRIDYQVIYGMVRLVKDGKEFSVNLYNHQFLDTKMIAHPSCFITKKVYDDFGLYKSDMKSSADYELMLRLFHKTDTIFTPVYKIISNFSIGGTSSTQTGVRETLRLRYHYGIITKFQCNKGIFMSYLYEFVTRFYK